MKLEDKVLIMTYQLLDGEKKMEKNIGQEETVGELTGESKVCSNYSEEKTTQEQKTTVLGLFLKTLGLKM